MKKSFKLIKKFLGLGILLVGLLFISNYLSSVHPVNNNFLSNHLDNITNPFVTPTYAFIAPSFGGGGGGGTEPGGGTVSLPVPSIWADSTTLNSGSYTRIKWNSTGATNCYVYGGTISSSGRSNNVGISTGALSDDTTYTAKCSNSAGSAYDTVKVNVFPIISSFYPESKSVDYNQWTILHWRVIGARSCWLSGKDSVSHSKILLAREPVSVGTASKKVINIKEATTYYLTCSTKTASTAPTGVPTSAGYCREANQTPNVCSSYKTRTSCLNSNITYDCVWLSS